MENNIGIKEAMTYNVITALTNTTITEIAAIMTKNNISAVVIEDEDNVRGIVTNTDIISKVVSKNIAPNDITAEMVMSQYIQSDLNISLAEASSLMMKNNTKILLIMENEQLKGIITSTDIVNVSPELIEIFVEKDNIDNAPDFEKHKNYDDSSLDEGVCEVCGVYGSLTEMDGQYICSDCIDEELEEE
jgi:CBS domain-containing protein